MFCSSAKYTVSIISIKKHTPWPNGVSVKEYTKVIASPPNCPRGGLAILYLLNLVSMPITSLARVAHQATNP